MNKIGKYEIVSELGRGATSTVFLALDTFDNQHVALKLFYLDGFHDSSRAKAYRKQLLMEASLAGKLSHPHIVRVFDAVMDGEMNYVVMEYVEGVTLEHYTKMENLLPLGNVAEIIYKCCKALEYAQHQGVIHRDIKPANILLCGQSEIKISDFGSAMVLNQQTTQVMGVGSPAYMSPEQVDEKELTHQTDIYSLGVAMFQLLTGKLPFEAGNSYGLIYQIMNVEAQPASSFRPEIPPELDAIVLRAMQKDLSRRYQAWDEFAKDLVNYFSNKVEEQTEIYDTEKFDTVRSLGFFKDFNDVELWEVLRLCKWYKVGGGERILSEGAEGRTFFILASGEVNVLKQGRLLGQLRKGDCFGEMAHLSECGYTRTTDVETNTDVTLIEINADVLEKSTPGCRSRFDGAFLRLLVNRLDIANARISQLLSD